MRKHEVVLKKAKILIDDLHEQYSLPIILLGVENTKMVVFNALRSGHKMSCLNQLKTHLWSSYTISSTNNTVGRRMYENDRIQRSNIRTYEVVLKSALKTYLWSSWKIFLINNTIWRWIYENGSIQRFNIRIYEFVLESAK